MEKDVSLKKKLDALQNLARERTVKTQNIEYDLETLVKKIKKGVIKINPDYQRNHRWKNITSSKLMESLILNIPVPTIYLSQDIDVDEEVEDDVARYSVIDGQQRLTAIYYFMSNAYELEGLEILEPLNGMYYKNLPPFLIRRLEERTIKCLRIDSTVDSQVKYDIFERLNSGSVQLEAQELRNAVYRGKFNELIKELAKHKYFREMLNIREKNPDENTKVKKMEDVEIVLRFFALEDDGLKVLKKSFKDFLSEQMANFNNCTDEELKAKKQNFINVMNIIYEKFGSKAFAKYKVVDGKLKLTTKFNASVYDALAIAVSMNLKDGTLKTEKQNIKQFEVLFRNGEFFDSIQGSTNDKSKITKRINMVREVLS